jgi:hypothetical protein
MKRPAPARAAAKAKGKTTTKGIGNDKGRGNDKGKAKGNGKDEKGTGKARTRKALTRRARARAKGQEDQLHWQGTDREATQATARKARERREATQSLFAKEEAQVKLWSQRKMEGGFALCLTDLAEKFFFILESTEHELKNLQEDQGCLTQEDDAKLKMVSHRLKLLSEKKHHMKYLKARLRCVCNLVQRMPGNVVPFTAAENEMIIKLSWQGWDWLVDKIARAAVDVLSRFVSEASKMIDNRATIAVIAQDAVPVYLDLSTGRFMRKPDDGPNQDDIILTWSPSS